MNVLRTKIENDSNIKKNINIFVFQAIRSFNIKNNNKILLKGGKLYNILTNENISFDIDVLYNSKDYNVESIHIFFSEYFDKSKKQFELLKNIIIKNKIVKIENKIIIKYSFLLYNTLIPFFEITFGDYVEKYWMYSYGIYCILPSQLITNLMDMANQNTFHKRFICRDRLIKIINQDFLLFNYNLDKEIFLQEYNFINNIPKGTIITLKSELLDNEKISKIKNLGSLEKYVFLNNFKLQLHYKLKEFKDYIDIFSETQDCDETIEDKYIELNQKFIEYTKNSSYFKYRNLTIEYLLNVKVLNLKYKNDKYKDKVIKKDNFYLTKKIISPLIIFSGVNNNFSQKSGEISLYTPKNKSDRYTSLDNDEFIENEKYFIKTFFQKSSNPNKEIKISKNLLGINPTLFVIIPNLNKNFKNVGLINHTECFVSKVLCLKKREIYYKVLIDKLTLLEKINLVILHEIIE